MQNDSAPPVNPRAMNQEQLAAYMADLHVRAQQPDATLTLDEVGILTLSMLHGRVAEVERRYSQLEAANERLQARISELERPTPQPAPPPLPAGTVLH